MQDARWSLCSTEVSVLHSVSRGFPFSEIGWLYQWRNNVYEILTSKRIIPQFRRSKLPTDRSLLSCISLALYGFAKLLSSCGSKLTLFQNHLKSFKKIISWPYTTESVRGAHYYYFLKSLQRTLMQLAHGLAFKKHCYVMPFYSPRKKINQGLISRRKLPNISL